MIKLLGCLLLLLGASAVGRAGDAQYPGEARFVVGGVKFSGPVVIGNRGRRITGTILANRLGVKLAITGTMDGAGRFRGIIDRSSGVTGTLLGRFHRGRVSAAGRIAVPGFGDGTVKIRPRPAAKVAPTFEGTFTAWSAVNARPPQRYQRMVLDLRKTSGGADSDTFRYTIQLSNGGGGELADSGTVTIVRGARTVRIEDSMRDFPGLLTYHASVSYTDLRTFTVLGVIGRYTVGGTSGTFSGSSQL